MNLSEYISVKNPHLNLDGLDKSKCCDNLMINGMGAWYCNKHRKIIGFDKDGTLKAMMYCQFYYRDHNCWLDLCEKVQKEEAEKRRTETEKAEREERALFEKIITNFNNAIIQNPNDAENYRLRGGAYAQRKEYDKAITDYNEAIRLNPNDAEAYAFRGSVYIQKKEYNQALDDFNEAIRLNPNCKNAYWFRGGMYGVKEEHDKSISDYEEALRIDPKDNTTKTLLENARKLKEEAEHLQNTEKQSKHKNNLANIGLLLQFAITIGFFCIFLGTNLLRTIESIAPLIIIPGVISLVFGIISRIFRSNINPKFPWGIGLLILTFAITSTIISVWEGSGITSSIICVSLLAIPIILILKFQPDLFTNIGLRDIGALIVATIVCAIVSGIIGSISKNYSMLTFVFLTFPSIPGFIVINKAEN
ncbi:MAG: tetratricopeptide repeat protein [Treponema sp.]|nr:tetratricopeptide repeat protein [Treponema sp.]